MRILFNTQFRRWEVYEENPIVRNGEAQPVFVSGSYERCAKYCRDVEGRWTEGN